MKITDFAVLFDMDGLLFDTEATLKRVWQSEAAKLGFAITDEMFARCVGVPNAVCEANLVQWLKGFSHSGISAQLAADPRGPTGQRGHSAPSGCGRDAFAPA